RRMRGKSGRVLGMSATWRNRATRLPLLLINWFRVRVPTGAPFSLFSAPGQEAVKSNLFAFAPAIKRGGVDPHLSRHPRQIIAAGFQKLFCHSEFLFSVKSDRTRVTRHWCRRH